MVQIVNHHLSLVGRCEIGKSQSTEDAVIEVIVEGVWKGKIHVRHQLHQLLLFHGKGDVLDDDGGRDEVVVLIAELIRSDLGHAERGGAERAVCSTVVHLLLVQPSLTREH